MIRTKPNSKEYDANYDKIFRKKKDDWDEARIDVIGQNGNTGEHYSTCQCTLRNKLVGDDCEVCNPERYMYDSDTE